MKYLNLILVAVLIGIVAANAAQNTTLSQREVRDPRKLQAILEANASDAETRISAIEGGTAAVTLATDSILVGNDSSNQTAMAVIGDVTITQDGTNVTTAIAAGVIVDADIKSDAAIVSTKLATAVQDSLALADSALQPDGDGSGLSGIAAAPAVAGSVDGTTNTVTITANDGAGNTIAAKRLMRVWMSETSGGSPSTNNIESVTLSGGAAIQTVSEAADYVYLTADTGIASAEIVGTAAGTNYVNVADGGYVTSAAVVFE